MSADGKSVVVACSVAQLAADLDKLEDPEAMVMVEIDGTARQIRGIRCDMRRTPDGTLVPIVTLVGHDLPQAEQATMIAIADG
jgi:hypothetical protein